MAHIHPFFGGKLLIANAFHMVSKETVITFFDNMQRSPHAYGFTEAWDATMRHDFQNFLKTLRAASQQNSALLPLPISRRLTALDPANSVFPMYTIFDFIGWIFSAANAVPDGANEENFYLPLAAIYAKICRILAAGYDRDYHTQPHLITLGHFRLHNRGHVILGATIGHPQPSKDSIQEARKAILAVREVIGLHEHQVERWDYGFCAESWFFTYAHAHNDVPRDQIYGLALNIGTYEKAYSKLMNTIIYDHDKFGHSRVPPCRNCQHIIGRLGLTLNHFRPPH